jgi:hypothetical protein
LDVNRNSSIWLNGHTICEKVTFSVPIVNRFEKMKPSFSEILSDASDTFEEIVTVQDAPARPWMRCPPADPKVSFMKVIENFSVKSFNFGNIDTDCARKGELRIIPCHERPSKEGLIYSPLLMC